ncbi:TlyA family rRNA (cytidine-2'-O)-methyltransferase [Parasaccharibacter sp. TMW2.1882]|uniref:TlyA family RNA methyltransferase n=1 Tax=Acetobacteraceae TaxID=433 RepID=UPI001327254F|nr:MULTISPECIES: TlyA family RNA methyltransferase [Acetobacteraceae]MCL1562580.1 TlyA family RNA methyltransferase [Parasaccharibacter sp. TMW 2.1886]MCQ0040658.1 TlyA family RNA methyltransferase [Bombella sp.]MUG79725.1 TlyA family rRNA (cytidine-2'-O)-methyltransferase [Bombella sp. ESL0380]MUH03017.1 TlyA family rRNA (cytidine-2'-O)-methyltransferase [Bombella sp. ESL0387]MCK8637016.1 TlyA family rRNA (cytidine-2'-O)-methyltransferase [Parasaccharibacter sp. TMW2.1885]
MAKRRADQLLVDRGLVETRSRAQALIMAGLVYAGPHGDRPVKKAGDQLAEDMPLTLKGQDHPWVSRGGLKLAHALEHFPLSAEGKIAVDVGASTGGFTDVLLQNGAAKVYAVDVGHGQLAWKIRSDDRVVVLEKTNARHLNAEHIPEAPDIVVCDASFISLKTVLAPALGMAKNGAWAVALIKPQFEAGRADIGPKGVVRDPAVHERVCEEIRDWFASLPGWTILGLVPSPITGPEGNREFLIAARKDAIG